MFELIIIIVATCSTHVIPYMCTLSSDWNAMIYITSLPTSAGYAQVTARPGIVFDRLKV